MNKKTGKDTEATLKKRLAAMNMVYQKYSLDYFFESMRRLDVTNFELWAGSPHLFCMTPSLSDVLPIRKKVREYGMNIVCVTPEQVMYPYNIACPDAQMRRESVEYFLRYIDITAELGADKLLCCAGWGDYDGDIEESWKYSVDSLRIMTDHAEKAGIYLAFEILGPQESNLVHDLAGTERMMNEIQSPNFTLCVDTVPVRVENRTLEEYFERFGKRISHFHLTDGNPAGHVPCGMGEHPVAEYLDTLKRYEYSGYITLEIGDTGCCTDPEGATRTGLDTVRNML